MKKYIIPIVAFVLLVLLGLKLFSAKIEGEWIAVSVIDNGQDTLNINNQEIKLSIAEDTYLFRTSLNQKEEGTIQKKGKRLILTPIVDKSPYKIHITELTKNTLTLRMNQAGQPRIVYMNRVTEGS